MQPCCPQILISSANSIMETENGVCHCDTVTPCLACFVSQLHSSSSPASQLRRSSSLWAMELTGRMCVQSAAIFNSIISVASTALLVSYGALQTGITAHDLPCMSFSFIAWQALGMQLLYDRRLTQIGGWQ